VAHRAEEGFNPRFKAGLWDLVDEFFSLDSSLVVVGEEDLNDGVKLEVHGS
jgi:hypothetical protein